MGRIDVLNRERFVEQLLRLVENMSANEAAASFAINGAWGCGKSFVLDMFEEQLGRYQSEKTATDKYFIIRYNCWKYDYYEEPLIAIVAAIIDVIEKKTKLFPDSQDNREILGMLKATGVSLLSMLNTAVKTKTGLDLQHAFETVNNGAKEAAAEYEKDHSFDVYFSFNKVMDKLNELLDQLSEKYTLVFLVDELDRCLPEYAIKVLERLHHLSEKSKNTITIISMDKRQLIKSVQQIFGFENPEKYLEKFIDFEIELNCGTVSEKVSEKYAEYISLFDKDAFVFPESIEVFMRELFTDIDIRTQEHIFKRAMLAHRLLFSDKKDYSFMCMELLLAVMICVYKDETCFSGEAIANVSLDKLFSSARRGEGPAFEKAFAAHFETLNFGMQHVYPEDREYYMLPDTTSLYGAIAFSWYWIHGKHKKIAFGFHLGSGYSVIANNHEELKKYAETLRMIK